MARARAEEPLMPSRPASPPPSPPVRPSQVKTNENSVLAGVVRSRQERELTSLSEVCATTLYLYDWPGSRPVTRTTWRSADLASLAITRPSASRTSPLEGLSVTHHTVAEVVSTAVRNGPSTRFRPRRNLS